MIHKTLVIRGGQGICLFNFDGKCKKYRVTNGNNLNGLCWRTCECRFMWTAWTRSSAALIRSLNLTWLQHKQDQQCGVRGFNTHNSSMLHCHRDHHKLNAHLLLFSPFLISLRQNPASIHIYTRMRRRLKLYVLVLSLFQDKGSGHRGKKNNKKTSLFLFHFPVW